MFLLAVVIVASVMIIGNPRTTRAEGLLYTVKCTVSGLLGKVCEKKTPNPTAPVTPVQPAPNTPEPAQQPATTPTVPPDTSAGVIAPPPTTPIALDEIKVEDRVLAHTVSTQRAYQYPSHVVASAYPTGVNGEKTIASSVGPAFLEATVDGWRLMGLLWYWWVVIFTALIGLVVLIRTTVIKSFFSIVK